MQFENTYFLVVGLLVCLGLVWMARGLRRSREGLLKQFASSHLVQRLTANVSPARRRAKFAFLVLAVACVFVALARPQAGFRWEEARRRGIDILMAVDTSRSMLANDVQPNRLARARLGILDFVSKLEGDRVGLIPFSGSAFLMCPLTLDYDAFRQSLNALDTTIMPRQGTDIASAIREAEAAFAEDAKHRILVLITDGEDLEGEALVAARTAAERGITIHTVGVGTPAGELIPVTARGGGAAFVKDEQGQVVKSRLDENMLRRMAEATGGTYEPLGRQAEGLDVIYERKLSLVPKEELTQRMRKVPLERFEWPLLFAFVFLAFEYILSDRRAAHGTALAAVAKAFRPPGIGRKLHPAVPAACLLLALVALGAQASPRAAEEAYEQGDYEGSARSYREALAEAPEDPKLQFNAGAAAYKNGDFAGAESAFEGVTRDKDLSLQGRAYYNLGNTLYRLGQETEQADPGQTIGQWQRALTSYRGTLALDPDDEDAQYNHDLVERRLEELQQQQEEQQQDNQCRNPDQEQDGEEDQEEGQQSEGGGSDGGEDNQENRDGESQGGGPEQDENNGDESSSSGSSPEEQDPSESGTQEPERDDAEEQEGGEQEANGGGGEGDEEPRDASPESGDEDTREPGNAPPRPDPSQAGQDRSSSGVGVRRTPGKMTPEEAADLLDSLKHDDGDTPFMPRPGGAGGGRDDDPRRTW